MKYELIEIGPYKLPRDFRKGFIRKFPKSIEISCTYIRSKIYNKIVQFLAIRLSWSSENPFAYNDDLSNRT